MRLCNELQALDEADSVRGRRQILFPQKASSFLRTPLPQERWRRPNGTIKVFDPSPLNWLFITWNTMEEQVRIDQEGHTKFAQAEELCWLDD
jgi:hypothetical protein